MNTLKSDLTNPSLFNISFFASHSSNPAIMALGQEALCYSDLAKQIQYTQDQLHEIGISRNHRVAVLLPQGPENAVLCLALMHYCCCVPINPQLCEAELNSIIEHLDLALLISAPENASITQFAKRKQLPQLYLLTKPNCAAGTFSLDINNSEPITLAVSAPPPDAELPSLILHTSGTTAKPKPVPLSRENLLASSSNIVESLALTQQDRAVNMMPLYHIGALLDLLLAPLLSGGSIIICRDLSAATFFKCLEKFKPSWHQGAPAMLAELCREARTSSLSSDCSSLRFCRSVSAPLPESIREQFETSFNIPIVEIYGMSEAAGLICSNSLTPQLQRKGSVGRASLVELDILDSYGNPSKPMQVGEIIIRGQNIFSGYLHQAHDKTDFIGDWFRTGDLGYLDDAGYLYLSGRLKDIINRGGEKIAPLEIDNALLGIPEVHDAACFALPHPNLGEDVAAAVILKHGNYECTDEIICALSEKLSQHKIPRQLFFCDTLPRNAGGKLQRHKLSEKYSSNVKFRAPTKVAPNSDLGRQLREMWQRHLECDDIGIDDNFFDLGGNSLSATSFISELESLLNCLLPPGILFDHPSIAALEQALSQPTHTAELSALTQLQRAAISYGIPADIFAKLHQYTSAWQGSRLHADSLLFAYNTLGNATPLFWGAQGEEEVANLARALGPNQPVYGFRSLYLIEGKNDQYSQAIAHCYLKDVLEIQTTGPFLLGGFCEAAKIAFTMASHLHQQHQDVRLLCLVEKFIPQHYSGKVSLFFCEDSSHSAFRHFQRPEIGWRKYYHGALSSTRLTTRHKKIFGKSYINDFAKSLNDELHCILSTDSPRQSIADAQPNELQHLPDGAYQYRLHSSLPSSLAPNQNIHLTIKIHNTSETAWQAGERSGIFLHARWRRQDKVRIWRAASQALPCTLQPNASVDISLSLKTPSRPGRWTLELGLSDEGICHFEHHGCSPLALPTTIRYGATLWRKTQSLIKDTLPYD